MLIFGGTSPFLSFAQYLHTLEFSQCASGSLIYQVLKTNVYDWIFSAPGGNFQLGLDIDKIQKYAVSERKSSVCAAKNVIT